LCGPLSSMNEKSKILVTCTKGVSPFLSLELSQLGFPVIEEKQLGVFTIGTFEDCIRLNFELRTGLQVLYLLKEFEASHPNELYDALFQMQWQHIIPTTGYVCVTSSVSNSQINNTQFANLKVKDAIVDSIAEKKGRRPDSGPDRSKTVVFLYWKENSAAIFLDTSGEPLSKRGYRKLPFKAPMQETLAAAVVMATTWAPEQPFVNPMCGSGTLGIEAALLGMNKAPGLLRNNFGFMHCLNFEKSTYMQVRREAKSKINKKANLSIIMTDDDSTAVYAALQNAKTAGVDSLLNIKKSDFAKTEIPPTNGVVVLNPPYGLRMGETERLETLYKGIGDFFKQSCPGYFGYIFSGNLPLLKKVGLKSNKRTPFFTSKIDSRLVEYQMYEGTK
jgi:putative N6-adenine-specific DNA methylase